MLTNPFKYPQISPAAMAAMQLAMDEIGRAFRAVFEALAKLFESITGPATACIRELLRSVSIMRDEGRHRSMLAHQSVVLRQRHDRLQRRPAPVLARPWHLSRRAFSRS